MRFRWSWRKRCIDDKLPLPPCCACAACAARMVPRDRREKLDNPHDPARGVLYTIFCRHDDDGSGTVTEAEFILFKLEKMGLVEMSAIKKISEQFDKIDTDKSGSLTLDDIQRAKQLGQL